MPIVIRMAEPADLAGLEAFLGRHSSARVARLGELVTPIDHPAIVAVDEHGMCGALTCIVSGSEIEVLTLHVDRQWRGTGTALLERVEAFAAESGCHRLFLVTTNDNVDALRFYQRRGYRLAELHPGAVDRSRETLKPEISRIGDHGIRLRDEIVLEKEIGDV